MVSFSGKQIKLEIVLSEISQIGIVAHTASPNTLGLEVGEFRGQGYKQNEIKQAQREQVHLFPLTYVESRGKVTKVE